MCRGCLFYAFFFINNSLLLYAFLLIIIDEIVIQNEILIIFNILFSKFPNGFLWNHYPSVQDVDMSDIPFGEETTGRGLQNRAQTGQNAHIPKDAQRRIGSRLRWLLLCNR